MKYDYLVVGSGLYGSVFARQATDAGKKVIVIDKNGTGSGKGFGKDVVQRLAIGQTLLEFHSFGGQLLVSQSLELGLQRLNLIHDGIDLLQFPLTVGAKQFRNQTHD